MPSCIVSIDDLLKHDVRELIKLNSKCLMNESQISSVKIVMSNMDALIYIWAVHSIVEL